MANNQTPSTSGSEIETNTFSKGMQKDIYAGLNPKEQWGHARNAANNSVDGDIGIIGNEPANLSCAVIPYTVIGAIKRYGDLWVVFSTDDTNSEIGLFDDSKCEYTLLVNDPCLNFNRKYLITGAAKENYDCTWQIYWDDGNNPSRTLNIDDIPYIQTIVSAPGADCVLYEDTSVLDCEKIRLAPLLKVPCVKLKKSVDGGQLRNGSYRAYIAYTLNEQVVTDYIGISNIQSLFSHDINGGSLDINITNLDVEFDYYELVILSDNQGQKVAKSIGFYSTEQSDITIDFIDPALVSISFDVLFLRGPAYEKSESMYVVNDYLIRQGPTEQFDFNYQILANNITSGWVVAEYDAAYYYKGGYETQFMRDEVYSFFIRWIYNTGEKSASYHIPGRAPSFISEDQFGNIMSGGDLGLNTGTNVISATGQEYNFQVFNSASTTSIGLNIPTEEGGTIIAKGGMAYWQSTEKYPATKPEIWGDLCGKEIRHHKFPTEETHSSLELAANNGSRIRILGVEFSNIERPQYNDGTYIENIVGYEILRGSREGAKSILAKGIFRNMRKYTIPDSDGNLGPTQGLYPNFPYNDLRSDVYHYDGSSNNPFANGPNNSFSIFKRDPVPRTDGCSNSFISSLVEFPPLTGYKRDVFTFHSPELMFRRPFLNPAEVRIYGAVSGESIGNFIKSEKHPQNKLLRNGAALIAGIVGIGYAIGQMEGTQEASKDNSKLNQAPYMPQWLGSSNTVGYNTFAGVAGLTVGNLNVGLNAVLDGILGEAMPLADLLGGGGSASYLATLVQGAIGEATGVNTPGFSGGSFERKYIREGDSSLLPLFFNIITGIINSGTQIAIGAQKVIDLLYNLVSYEDFAFKHNSSGLFDSYHPTKKDLIFRTRNELSNYIGSTFQNFNNEFKINNLFRPDTVAIKTSNPLPIPTNLNAPQDISRYTVGGDSAGDFTQLNSPLGFNESYITNPNASQSKPISVLYGALKFNFENQYGQLDGIKQVLMNDCVYEIDLSAPEKTLYSTGGIFSGDTYVGRYTEKVIMPIFSDFLYGQPDQFPYNYLQRINLPYPRFWMDTRKYDTSAWADVSAILGNALDPNSTLLEDMLPNDLFYLDRGIGTCTSGLGQIFQNKGGNTVFAMKQGYMYTHCNGILDFFVESEVNLPSRDWGDTPQSRHYDNFRYENVADLFNAAIIKDDNSFKYDYSLSASRFLTNLTSGGNVQPRDYNPEIAETCFTYYPKRLIYSLQAQKEAKKDFWKVFLVNNYKDFKNPVNVIKPINKSGAIIFFPYQSPQMFQGLDQLQTDLGTKLTIGDGGLFSQPFQNLVNSDISNEYGSCESQRGVINTPYGFFFISQAQGKIFQQSGQSIEAISNRGMKWWFNKYLPSHLVMQFPELEFSELSDNPVIGVGCQITYDITDDILYVCKKDFELKAEWEGTIIYDEDQDCFVRLLTTVPVPSNPPPVPPVINNPGPIKDPNAPNTPVPFPLPKDNGFVSPVAKVSLISESRSQPVKNYTIGDSPHTLPSPRECIEIGDPLYFNDCSWTVSYDPKVEAWISFHDWHPELCLSSINHFLTTQADITDIPQCPPNFNFNPATGDCERLINETVNAVVSIDEIPSNIIGGDGGSCLVDIVIAMDTSGSTNLGGRKQAMQAWLTSLLTNQNIAANMASGQMQIGFTSWSVNSIEYDIPDGMGGSWSMSNTVNPIDVTNWYNANWQNSNTIELAGLQGAQPLIDDKLNSQLGDRTSQPGFKQIIIMVSDSEGGITFNTGCPYQGLGNSPLASGPANQSLFALFVGLGVVEPGNSNYMPQLTCTPTGPVNVNGYTFGINASAAPSTWDGVADAISEGVCGTPATCDCPPGYTLVYYNQNELNFTLADGNCVSDSVSPSPICRKVECRCLPGPDPNAVVTETGECDNVYLAGPTGDLSYINLNPKRCNFNLLQNLPANYKVGGIWRHNYRCDLFANYYNVDYPWEVELIENTGQSVFTVRSLEYQLESYVYKGDLFNGCGDDRWHDLDFNFDESIIYNTEQVSGLLRLELDPKEDPLTGLNYPIINANDIQILFSKVEQKYRFNQFWDITNDRGEFTNAEQQILITQCNGYIRDLNSFNLDYAKDQGQRKKFRHYYNKVILRRTLSTNRKMLLKLNNSKLNLSFR